jgi:hypothetical protein
LGVFILWPQKDGFVFGLKPVSLIDLTKPSRKDSGVVGDAAKSLAGSLKVTEEKVENLAVLLQIQLVTLVLEILVWTFDIWGR